MREPQRIRPWASSHSSTVSQEFSSKVFASWSVAVSVEGCFFSKSEAKVAPDRKIGFVKFAKSERSKSPFVAITQGSFSSSFGNWFRASRIYCEGTAMKMTSAFLVASISEESWYFVS